MRNRLLASVAPWLFMGIAALLLMVTLAACNSVPFRASKPVAKESPQQAEIVPDDPVGRYELKDFRHGSIVGLALVDRKLGRVWLLSNVRGLDRQSTREFREVAVEGLWKTDASVFALYGRGGEAGAKIAQMVLDRDDNIKQRTRPRVVIEAEKDPLEKKH